MYQLEEKGGVGVVEVEAEAEVVALHNP